MREARQQRLARRHCQNVKVERLQLFYFTTFFLVLLLIDPKSLGPNAIAIETAATMVGVSADDVSTFSCALMQTTQTTSL